MKNHQEVVSSKYEQLLLFTDFTYGNALYEDTSEVTGAMGTHTLNLLIQLCETVE